MTISDINTDRNQYTKTAVDTVFAYTYKIFLNSDLLVYFTPTGQTINEVDDLLTLGVDYTVSNVGVDGGGNVTFLTNLTATGTVTIQRNIALSRTTDYSAGGQFTASSFNAAFEKSRAIEQQLRSLIEVRGLYYSTLNPLSAPTTTRDNLIPVLGPGQLWKMNAAGTTIVAADSTEPVSCSSLRSELASQVGGSDGATLVGYDSPNNGGTNIDLELDYLNPPIPDNVAHIKNASDNTKKIQWNASVVPTATTVTLTAPVRSSLIGYPPGHYQGFELSNDTDADHDIQINKGNARVGFTNNVYELTSVLTKQIDANWAEGDDAGGFPSALTLSNNTWYRVFLILADDGSVDGGYDTSATATNLLADATDYTYHLQVGWVKTDGSANILPFLQNGLRIDWSVPILDLNATNPGTGAKTLSISTPPEINNAILTVRYEDSTSSSMIFVSSLNQTDTAPTAVNAFTCHATNSSIDINTVIVPTNNSGQVRYRLDASHAGTIARVLTNGWYRLINTF